MSTNFFSATTLDDLMYDVLEELLKRPFNISSTRSKHHGKSSEIIGASLLLKNPRARLSRTETRGKPFSALGELLWYLSGTNKLDFISHYIPYYRHESEDKNTIYGGYGPRLFKFRGNLNQVETIIDLLKRKRSTRRAVIQLFDAEDITNDRLEIPCTCTLQFAIRDNKLHMVTSMRSNDACIGLPHDIFAFTMLQEIIAQSLGVGLGFYHHFVCSLHLYENKKTLARQYLKEGRQATDVHMPTMPPGDPWAAIKIILQEESKIRNKKPQNENISIDKYWVDLIRLLNIHSMFKQYKYKKVEQIKKQMSSKIYNVYIDSKLQNV